MTRRNKRPEEHIKKGKKREKGAQKGLTKYVQSDNINELFRVERGGERKRNTKKEEKV